MTKDIKFIGLDPLTNDIDCTDGEIRLAYGATTTADGAVSAPLECRTILAVPTGYRIVAIHEVLPIAQVIMVHTSTSDASIMLCHSPYRDDGEIPAEQISEIGQIDAINAIEILDNRVAIGTAAGLSTLIWEGARYTLINTEIGINLELGLKKIGHLTTADVIHTTGDAIANVSTTDNGSGASRPHSATSEARSQSIDLTAAISLSYSRAIGLEVTSKGLFHQPFLVRYALRGSAGTILYLSSPMLMLPTVNPPRICVTASTSQPDDATLSLDLSYNNIFQLVYRATQLPQSHLSNIIEAVDIYATLPINTYDSKETEMGYITAYDAVLTATDSGGAHRGRVSRAVDAQFDGHYSDDGVTYCEHTLDVGLASRQIWFVAPNRHLHDDIACAARYYRIASIDYASISTAFTTIEVVTTDPAALASHPTLDDYRVGPHTPIPAALLNYNGNMIVGANARRLKAPEALTAITAFAGRSDQGQGDAVVTKVYIKRQGCVYVASSSCAGHQYHLLSHFPRYLYYPDKDAYLMTLTQGGTTWSLPLKAHDALDGAYWWGGTDIDHAPLDQRAAPMAVSSVEGTDGVVYLSDGTVFASMVKQLTTGVGKIERLTTALHRAQGGAFGDYPIYAIGNRGVQRLQYADNTRVITAARHITHIGCANPQAVTYGHGQVIYACREGLCIIDGSDVKTMPVHLADDCLWAAKLPHFEVVMHEALLGSQRSVADLAPQGADSTANEIKGLFYDRDNCRLIVSAASTWVYDLRSHLWSLTDLPTVSHVAGADRYGVDADGSLVSIAESQMPGAILLFTRPIKLSSPMGLHDLKSIEVLGEWTSGNVALAVYGANRLGRWHLIKSAKCEYAYDVNTHRYRLHCLAVFARLAKGEYIAGASIEYM